MSKFVYIYLKILFISEILGISVLESNLYRNINTDMQNVVNKIFALLKINRNFTLRYENQLLLSMHASLKTASEKKYKYFKRLRAISKVEEKLLNIKNNLFLLDEPISKIIEEDFSIPLNDTRRLINDTLGIPKSLEIPEDSKERFTVLREYLNNVENIDIADITRPSKKINEIYERHRQFQKAYKRNLKFWESSNITEELETRRVFDGHQARIKKFPFIASIHVRTKFSCTGSIISREMVLTAASCVQAAYHNPKLLEEYPGAIGVRVGSDFPDRDGDYIGVLAVYFHPSFQFATLKNNLAIIKIKKYLHLGEKNSKVRRIQYQKIKGDLSSTIHEVVFLGWGDKDSPSSGEEVNDHLSWSKLQVVKIKDCMDIYTSKYVSDKNFCVGFAGKGGGACQHDTGGPGVVSSILVGIVSFGPPVCGTTDAPTVFTNIGHYVDWIDSVLNKPNINTIHPSKENVKVQDKNTITSSSFEPKYRIFTPLDYPMMPLTPRSLFDYPEMPLQSLLPPLLPPPPPPPRLPAFLPMNIELKPRNMMPSYKFRNLAKPRPLYPKAMHLLSFMLKDIMFNSLINDMYNEEQVDEQYDFMYSSKYNPGSVDNYTTGKETVSALELDYLKTTAPLEPPDELSENETDVTPQNETTSPKLYKKTRTTDNMLEKFRELEKEMNIPEPEALIPKRPGVFKSKYDKVSNSESDSDNNYETEEKSGLSIELRPSAGSSNSMVSTVSNFPKEEESSGYLRNVPLKNVRTYSALNNNFSPRIIGNSPQNKVIKTSPKEVRLELPRDIDRTADLSLKENLLKSRIDRQNLHKSKKIPVPTVDKKRFSFEEQLMDYLNKDVIEYTEKGNVVKNYDDLVLFYTKQTTEATKKTKYNVMLSAELPERTANYNFDESIFPKSLKTTRSLKPLKTRKRISNRVKILESNEHNNNNRNENNDDKSIRFNRLRDNNENYNYRTRNLMISRIFHRTTPISQEIEQIIKVEIRNPNGKTFPKKFQQSDYPIQYQPVSKSYNEYFKRNPFLDTKTVLSDDYYGPDYDIQKGQGKEKQTEGPEILTGRLKYVHKTTEGGSLNKKYISENFVPLQRAENLLKW